MILTHLKTIIKHRTLVMKLCFKAGLYKRGLLHDLSKFSWIELESGFKYATGSCSPITIQKKKEGYSRTWLHHIHHNKHHWEYWYDPDTGITAPMPNEFIFEAFCDRVAAATIYLGKNCTNEYIYNYFLNGNDKDRMGEWNAIRLRLLLCHLVEYDLDWVLKNIKNGTYNNYFNSKLALEVKDGCYSNR